MTSKKNKITKITTLREQYNSDSKIKTFLGGDSYNKEDLIIHVSYNGYDDYYSLSANDTTDMILISAYPEFTNIFYQQFPIFEDTRIQGYVDTQFTFLGKRFSFDNKWYLSAAAPIPGLIFEEIHDLTE
jgi:hypothetical protein